MIIVTVEIPIMDLTYDFQIDEDVPFHIVRDEIADMVCRKNQCRINGDVRDMMCWDKKRRLMLNLQRTGYENGLETGSELILA